MNIEQARDFVVEYARKSVQRDRAMRALTSMVGAMQSGFEGGRPAVYLSDLEKVSALAKRLDRWLDENRGKLEQAQRIRRGEGRRRASRRRGNSVAKGAKGRKRR